MGNEFPIGLIPANEFGGWRPRIFGQQLAVNPTLALPLLRGGLGGVEIDGNITTDLGLLYICC